MDFVASSLPYTMILVSRDWFLETKSHSVWGYIIALQTYVMTLRTSPPEVGLVQFFHRTFYCFNGVFMT